jgi:hypothetical protein
MASGEILYQNQISNEHGACGEEKSGSNLEGTLMANSMWRRPALLACLCFSTVLYGCSGSEVYASRQALLTNRDLLIVRLESKS